MRISARRFVSAHFGWTLLLVGMLGFCVRLVYLAVVGPHTPMGLDAAWYAVEGHAIAHGNGYIDPRTWLMAGASKPTANFPPLWPVVLAAADKIGLGSSTRNQYVGAFLGSVTIVFAGLIGRRIGGRRLGLLVALLVALNPMLIAADGSLMSESLYVLLITAAVLLAYRAIESPRPLRFALVGAALGLAAITRTDALFLAPIMLVALVWRIWSIEASRRTVLAATFCVVVLLPSVAWSVYASPRMGGLVIATSNSGNLFTGANCPSTYYGSLLGAWDEHCASNFAPQDDERRWAARARAKGIDYAKSHLQRLPVVVVARELRVWGFWDPVQTAHLEGVETRNIPWQLTGWAIDLVLIMFAIGGAVIALKRRYVVAPLFAVVAGVIVTAALSNGNQRFRLAGEPVIAVFASIALLTLWTWFAHRNGNDRQWIDR